MAACERISVSLAFGSSNSPETILTYIVNGVTQAINNKQQNLSIGNNIVKSILYFDKDAYLKAYAANLKAYAANPIDVTAEYQRLVLGGGGLHLVKDPLSSSLAAVNQILTEIKNNTSN